jgi:hypothetical protein
MDWLALDRDNSIYRDNEELQVGFQPDSGAGRHRVVSD